MEMDQEQEYSRIMEDFKEREKKIQEIERRKKAEMQMREEAYVKKR